MNRSTPLFDWEISQPDKTCIITDHERYTYADVCAAVRAAASALAGRITPGTRVGLFIDSTPNFVLYQYAVFYLGGVVTPINRAMTRDEVRRVVERLEIPLVITDADLDLAGAAAVHRVTGEFDAPDAGTPVAPADLDVDTPAMLLQTSGSTGVPKGVLLNQRNLLANYDPTYRWIGVGRDDVLLLTLPIFNTYALNQGINMLAMSGGTMRLLRRFSPEAVATALTEDRPTFLPLVPTMLTRMRQADIRYDAPIKVGIGAAPSPSKIVDDAWTVFPQAHLYLGYGLTEATAIASLNHIGTPEQHHDNWASTGPVVTGINVRIDDPGESDGRGEILIKGDAVLRGYVGTDEPIPVHDGWLHTGDVGYFRDGRLNIVDRIRELIIRGGQNIYPGEIERALSLHPAVLEAAVVGRPDDDLGEIPIAFVVLRRGTTATSGDLRAWVRDHLAAFKIPAAVTIMESLPKTPTGKIQKRELRSHADVAAPG
jgi:long-chain acyl-CoA synthetase